MLDNDIASCKLCACLQDDNIIWTSNGKRKKKDVMTADKVNDDFHCYILQKLSLHTITVLHTCVVYCPYVAYGFLPI